MRWFESEGERGARALAMLRLMGLFDRPADAGCLAAFWTAPPIEGLTESLFKFEKKWFGVGQKIRPLDAREVNVILKRLADAKLVTVNRDAGGALVSLDAHPLLREYFAKDLRETRREAWKAAHKRIYQHLTTTTQDKPEPTLDDLQPLYQAVAHGCHAGLQQEACDKVYTDRILRGTGSDGFYSIQKLGAFGADLGAVACFFEPPWGRVSPNLTPPNQAWLFNSAAQQLRGLGRLTEALEPMRAALEWAVPQRAWTEASVGAGNLSELQLKLGEVEAAILDGAAAVVHADSSGEAFQRIFGRTKHADALHQAGRRADAEARFVEAEAIQAKLDPAHPMLYSQRGFRYCDLLLGVAERAALELLTGTGNGPSATLPSALDACDDVAERARRTLAWVTPQNWLLDIGLDHLTLARASLHQAILRAEPPSGEHVKEALDVLRRAGSQDHLPHGLLTRALFRATTWDFDGAREDLDEAFEIAERGPMRLHLADIHLHRARLFGLMAGPPKTYPWVSPRDDLDKARKLIDECGYGRRREELEDAEAAWERVSGTTVPAGSPPA